MKRFKTVIICLTIALLSVLFTACGGDSVKVIKTSDEWNSMIDTRLTALTKREANYKLVIKLTEDSDTDTYLQYVDGDKGRMLRPT